jgi:hypothetical protein
MRKMVPSGAKPLPAERSPRTVKTRAGTAPATGNVGTPVVP